MLNGGLIRTIYSWPQLLLTSIKGAWQMINTLGSHIPECPQSALSQWSWTPGLIYSHPCLCHKGQKWFSDGPHLVSNYRLLPSPCGCVKIAVLMEKLSQEDINKTLSFTEEAWLSKFISSLAPPLCISSTHAQTKWKPWETTQTRT